MTNCPATKAAIARILMEECGDVSHESRRKLQGRLEVMAIGLRHDGAETERGQNAAAIANKALLCTGRDEQERRRGLLEAKLAIESRSL
jgi:hypothetical protein